MGTHLPLPQRGGALNFRTISVVAKWLHMDQDATWYAAILSLSPGEFALDGDVPRSPSPKRGRSPQFSAHVYRDQTAGWIKMTLGMEVNLSPGDLC